MSDLISRQDAIDILDDFESDIELGERDSYKMHRGRLLSLPSADRPTGEWTKRQKIGDVDFAYCSECKEPILHGRGSPLWNYCPNCGARMKGGAE